MSTYWLVGTGGKLVTCALQVRRPFFDTDVKGWVTTLREQTKKKSVVGITRGDPARTRELILTAALAEFAKNGLGGARVDVIAKRARVNKQALYYHFGNKQGLFRATLEYGYKSARDVDTRLSEWSGDPRQMMGSVIAAFFESMKRHRHVIALVSEENRLGGRHLAASPEIIKLNAPFVRHVHAIYEDGVRAGQFRPDVDPDQLWITIVSSAQMYFSNIHSLSHILGKDLNCAEALEARRRHVVDFVLAGLSAR